MHEGDFAAKAEKVKEQLYRTAYGYLGDPSAALESVDEALYQGFRGCRKLRNEAYFLTWITRILINICLKELKRRKRESPWADPQHARKETPVPEDYDALPLKEAVASLPTELRDVILLRFFSDYSLAQTAEVLSIPRGTVSSRQQKALQLLRLQLAEPETAESPGSIGAPAPKLRKPRTNRREELD